MEWSTAGLISYVVLWVVVVLQAVMTLALARLVGQLMSRRFPAAGARVLEPGPDLGAKLPSWEATDVLGKRVSFEFPRARGLFLLYVSPHCTVCAALLPSARRFFSEIAREAEGVWVIVQGRAESQVEYA